MQFGEGIQEMEDMDLEEGKNVVPLDVKLFSYGDTRR
jgi:hypothetical protein